MDQKVPYPFILEAFPTAAMIEIRGNGWGRKIAVVLRRCPG